MTQLRAFRAGNSIQDVLEYFQAHVNSPETIFSTDHWLAPKLETLRGLLTDPVTPDEATALEDVLYGRHQMRDLIEWLDSAHDLSWAEFFPF